MGNELLSVASSLKHCYNCISKAHFAKGKIIRKGGQTHLTQIQIRCETNNSTDSAQMGNVVPRAPQLGSFSTVLLFTFQTLVFILHHQGPWKSMKHPFTRLFKDCGDLFYIPHLHYFSCKVWHLQSIDTIFAMFHFSLSNGMGKYDSIIQYTSGQ